jgi:hypothetical protein
MHQQVRTSIRKTRSDGARGGLDEGDLVEILRLLKVKNLRSAGRVRLDDSDEFVFSVRHRKGDDTQDQHACKILTDEGYDARVCEVRHLLLDDEEGALLAFVEQVENDEEEPAIEVHILTSEPNKMVPVQVVTRSMVERSV